MVIFASASNIGDYRRKVDAVCNKLGTEGHGKDKSRRTDQNSLKDASRGAGYRTDQKSHGFTGERDFKTNR